VSETEYDPYAPPREHAIFAPAPRSPPPAGIRRYGLDLDGYRARVGRALRGRVVRGIVVGLVYFGVVVGGGAFPITMLYVAIPVWAVTGASYLFALARARRLETRVMQGYELLVSPRVLRRTAFGAPPAEILAPEVSSIVELPDGLSIAAHGPPGRLFVPRSVERFAEVRDHLRAWGPIELRAGARGYIRRLSHLSGEKTRDALDGALALDPSLRGELDAVRALAMPFDPRSVRGRRPLRVAVFVITFAIAALAVGRLLAPGRHSRQPRPRTSPTPISGRSP